MFFIRPAQVHFWETKSIEGYALLFQEDFIISASTSSAHNEAFDMMMLLAHSISLCLDETAMIDVEKILISILKRI